MSGMHKKGWSAVTLAKASRPSENGQGDCSPSGGGEKGNLIPPM